MRSPYLNPSEQALLRALGLPGGGSGVRASDEERERAADALRRHHTDGRLSTDELGERIERAYAATTRGDLDRLFVDLPRLRAPERERRSDRGPVWTRAALPILAVLVAIAVVSSHGPWLIWPLMFFLAFRFRRWSYRGRVHGIPEPRRHY